MNLIDHISHLHKKVFMNTLLLEVLQWMQNNHYRRASFERLTGIIPSARDYDQLADLVDQYPQIFRTATMKGGLEGLALQDEADLGYLIAAFSTTTSPYAASPATPLTVPSLNASPTAPPAAPVVERERVSAVGTVPEQARTVTAQDIENEIQSTFFINPGEMLGVYGPISTLTLCLLTLRNGYTIVGKSACVYPELFDADLGKSLARADAVKQVWPLLGFRLADQRTAKTF